MTEGRGQAKPDGAENLSHQALIESSLDELIILDGEQVAKEQKRTLAFLTPSHISFLVLLSGGFHLVVIRVTAQGFQQHLRTHVPRFIQLGELLNRLLPVEGDLGTQLLLFTLVEEMLGYRGTQDAG
jgi:hypothetical protein